VAAWSVDKRELKVAVVKRTPRLARKLLTP